MSKKKYLNEILIKHKVSIDLINDCIDEDLIELKLENGKKYFDEYDYNILMKILNLKNDLGVNLEGICIILDMRKKMEKMQIEISELIEFIMKEMDSEFSDFQEKFKAALSKAPSCSVIKLDLKKDKSD